MVGAVMRRVRSAAPASDAVTYYRLTEAGDQRLTQAGDVRLTEAG